MDWIIGLFGVHSAVQTIVVLSVIIASGFALGKIHVRGVSLGIAFVFFMGIVAGHIGLDVDAGMLSFAETFGLSLFVYMLGLHVGPNFFGLMKHEGMAFNAWSLALVTLGTVVALMLCPLTNMAVSDMMGLLCGATTNTPALGAAQQALIGKGLSSSGAALACAVAYPLGVVGVIFVMMFLRRFFVKADDLLPHHKREEDNTYIAQYVITNPALEGKRIVELSQILHRQFVITRLWRSGKVILPLSETVLHNGDNVLVLTKNEDREVMAVLFGRQVEKDWDHDKDKIDWNAIDSNIESKVIVLTKMKLNGRTLGSLHMRTAYGVNVSRIMRGDIKLLASDNLRLQYGDRLTVVGTPTDIAHACNFVGNAVQNLNEPNIGAIFLGLIMGLMLGMLPISLPGMSAPVKLGIAGGPIIMGILVGALGSRAHFISYTTRSASLMLRKLGLSLYLACLGLAAGREFFDTVVRPEGLMWIGIGFLLTVVPTAIIGIMALRSKKFDFGTVCGILCGAMANPMALSYANETLEDDSASVSYTSVYPLGMFVRVVLAQVIVMAMA